MCCIAKVYSSIINSRLQSFLEKNDLLSDEQNGFRSARSCIDHIFALITILRNRKLKGMSTFICFIDYKKAFDSVDRNLLLFKLSKIGITGKVYRAISSLHKNPKSRVILNNYTTEWFNCPVGVKQGDIMSPTLFAIFIDDLVTELKESGCGIKIDDTLLCCLLYADDLVLIAESEGDLQVLLDVVNKWCAKWRLEVNLSKTKVMHVRKANCKRSEFKFKFEGKQVDYAEKYKYLGISINEHLKFEQSVQDLCDSASRALSSIIAKMIKNGGFPLNVYQALYEACICSITDYASEVIGYREYLPVEKVHNRAIRAFLGLNKHAAVPGMRAEIGWMEPRARSQVKMIRMYHRLINMPDNRLTKKVFLWDRSMSEEGNSTWSNEVKSILTRNNLNDIFNINIFDLKSTIDTLKKSLHHKDLTKLKNLCVALPKLRTYNLVTGSDSPKAYLLKPLTFMQKRSLAKLRLGTLQLRIETGRYERPRMAVEDRICEHCPLGKVETEAHFLLECPKHLIQRRALFSKIVCFDEFNSMDEIDKLKYLLNNSDIVKSTAQFIIAAFDNRLVH